MRAVEARAKKRASQNTGRIYILDSCPCAQILHRKKGGLTSEGKKRGRINNQEGGEKWSGITTEGKGKLNCSEGPPANRGKIETEMGGRCEQNGKSAEDRGGK